MKNVSNYELVKACGLLDKDVDIFYTFKVTAIIFFKINFIIFTCII